MNRWFIDQLTVVYTVCYDWISAWSLLVKHIDMLGGIEQVTTVAQWPYCAMRCSEGVLKARALTKHDARAYCRARKQ